LQCEIIHCLKPVTSISTHRHTHTHTRARTHTHIHTRIHTYTQTSTHTYTYTHHTYTHKHINTNIHTHTHIYTYTHTRIHHIHIHTITHTHHTHTYTRTSTQTHSKLAALSYTHTQHNTRTRTSPDRTIQALVCHNVEGTKSRDSRKLECTYATVLDNSIATTALGHSTLQHACHCKHANRLESRKLLMRQHATNFILILRTPHSSVLYTVYVHFNKAADYYESSVLTTQTKS
jgi:hypothetical protein